MPEIAINAALLLGGLFTIILSLCGALLVGVGLFALQRHRAAAGWPQVPARIEASEVVAERRFEDDLMYRPVVRYRYAAPGGSFLGDKLATTTRLYAKPAAAQNVVDRYPVGTSVMARYNPEDASEAVLERNGSGGPWFIVFGLLCWIVPFIFLRALGVSWSVFAGLFVALAVIFTLLLCRRSTLAEARRHGLCPPAGSASDADIADLVARGEKLLAIHLYRELHGGGLKAARQAVEALQRESSGLGP